MYELVYLYEQLKKQTVEQQYINVLDSISESTYDTLTPQENINETMLAIEEASNKNRFNFFDKLKAQLTTVKKVLDKYKEPALKCRPIGLVYKDFKTFMTAEDIKKMHTQAINYINKFNPEKASAEDAKKYIIDSQHNVQYKEIIKIFGGKGEIFNVNVVITSEKDKEITKNDIVDAVKFLEGYNKQITQWQAEFTKIDKEFANYVQSNSADTLSMNKTNTDDINKLRKNAKNHKISLTAIADEFYYHLLIYNYRQKAIQAKRIVVKAASYNPRNLKESAVTQDYIDAMCEFLKY